MTIGAVAIGAGLIGGPEAAAQAAGIFPEVTLSWSPTTNPGATPAWVAVGSDFRSGETRRGRSRELDRFQAGSGRFILNNRDRDYDPEYSAGPWFGNILPLRRFKLEASFAGVTYGVLDGYVDSWDQSYVQSREAITEVSITDAFKIFALAGLPSPWEVEIRADGPHAWYRLGDAAASTTVADSSGNGFTGTVVPTVTFGATGLVAQDSDAAMSMTGASTSHGVTCSIAGAGTSGTEIALECWINPASLAADTLVMGQIDATLDHGVLLALEADGGGYLSVVTTAGSSARSNIPAGTFVVGQTHHVVGVFSASTVVTYVNGVAYDPEISNGGSFQGEPIHVGWTAGLPAGISNFVGTIDEALFYDRALTASEVATHYNAGKSGVTGALGGQTSGERCEAVLDYVEFPASEREIATGQSTLQSTGLNQSALGHLQTVEDSEQGLFFMGKDGKAVFRERHDLLNLPSTATFGDGAGELRYADIDYDFDDQPIRNVVRRQREGGTVQEARDATSIAKFYARVESTSGLFNESDDEVRDSSYFRLGNLKDALLRVTELRIEPRRDPANLFPVVLGLELGDQITVRRRPQGVGPAIDQVVRVEGISHSIGPKQWTTTLQLSPYVGATGDFFQLDKTSGPGLGDMKLAW